MDRSVCLPATLSPCLRPPPDRAQAEHLAGVRQASLKNRLALTLLLRSCAADVQEGAGGKDVEGSASPDLSGRFAVSWDAGAAPTAGAEPFAYPVLRIRGAA